MSCVMEKLVALKLASAKSFPFFIAGAAGVQLNTTRLAEAILIACLTGGVSVYATTQALKAEVENIKISLEQQREAIEKLRVDLYRPATGVVSK